MLSPHSPVPSRHVDPQTFSGPQAPHPEKAEKKCVLRHELINYPSKWGRKSIEREIIYKGS